MKIFLWLVFGLLVLKAVVASPRFSRQVDYDSYNTVDYGDGEGNFYEDNYDYGEQLTVEEAEVWDTYNHLTNTSDNIVVWTI